MPSSRRRPSRVMEIERTVVRMVRSGEIGDRLSGEMGYTYRHDALAKYNPDGREYSFRWDRFEGVTMGFGSRLHVLHVLWPLIDRSA